MPLVRPFPWEAHYPAGLAWDFAAEPRPLFTLLDDAVATFANRPCLDFLGRKSSYREIGQLVDRAAKGFQALGVGPGVRVGLFLPNCPYYVICFFAVLKAGGTVVNYNPLYAEREIARQIEDSNTSIMVTLNIKATYPKVARRLADTCLKTIVVGSMGGLLPWRERTLFAVLRRREIADVPTDARHVRFKMLIANDGRYAPVTIDPSADVAVLQYTGGTTGSPKGAMLTHAALHANTRQVAMWAIGSRPGQEKVVGALPLFHVFGMTGVMNAALAGGFEIILLPRFRLDQLLKVIAKERATVLLGVPTMYSAINGSQLLEQYDLSSLRFCISGGAPLPRAVQDTFERLTGCPLVEGYGLTEAGPVCTINPFGAARAGSIGLPLPGTLVEITAIDDPDRRLPHRPARRDLHQRAAGHGGLRAAARGHRRGAARRPPAYRRRRLSRCGRLRLRGRPDQGPDPERRLQRLPAHGRGGDPAASRGRRGERVRRARPASRRDRQGLRPPVRGRRADRARSCARSCATSSPRSSSRGRSSSAPSCRSRGSASRRGATWSPRRCAA